MTRDTSERWWLALLGLPILCCAGTTVIAALGAGSVTAAVGGLTGSVVIVAVGVAIMVITATLIVRRRSRR